MTFEGTRLETDEEVQQALRRYRPAPHVPAPAVTQTAPPDDAPPLFRPTRRPAMPVLTVLDDGVEEGETIRIRKDSFLIGRTEGDLVIPHDVQMSGRHAELRRGPHKDKFRWQLMDLKSTNGTYVRVGHAVLQHGQEFLLGRTRYRFENQSADSDAAAKSQGATDHATRPWQNSLEQGIAPAVVELVGEKTGPRVLVSGREAWLGRGASYCQIVLRDDPFVSARHARIRLDQEGRWLLENNKSVNGVWLRIERLTLKGTCHFLLGEQSFIVRIPA